MEVTKVMELEGAVLIRSGKSDCITADLCIFCTHTYVSHLNPTNLKESQMLFSTSSPQYPLGKQCQIHTFLHLLSLLKCCSLEVMAKELI